MRRTSCLFCTREPRDSLPPGVSRGHLGQVTARGRSPARADTPSLSTQRAFNRAITRSMLFTVTPMPSRFRSTRSFYIHHLGYCSRNSLDPHHYFRRGRRLSHMLRPPAARLKIRHSTRCVGLRPSADRVRAGPVMTSCKPHLVPMPLVPLHYLQSTRCRLCRFCREPCRVRHSRQNSLFRSHRDTRISPFHLFDSCPISV